MIVYEFLQYFLKFGFERRPVAKLIHTQKLGGTTTELRQKSDQPGDIFECDLQWHF